MGFSPQRLNRSSQASGGVSDKLFSSQFPDPPPEPMSPFMSRVDTWIYELVNMGYHRDFAEILLRKINLAPIDSFRVVGNKQKPLPQLLLSTS